MIRRAFTKRGEKEPPALSACLSPFLTCEEAYLLAKFLKGLSGAGTAGAGPGAGRRRRTTPIRRTGAASRSQPVKFTIRAEKCPNRRGVEEVLRHFQGEVIGFRRGRTAAADGRVQALYLAAGYPPRPGGWISEEQAQALQKVPLVVCHDLLPSPVSSIAHYVLAGASFAEKDGTFVNHAGLAQAIHWGVDADRRDVAPMGRSFWICWSGAAWLMRRRCERNWPREVPYLRSTGRGRPGRIWHSIWRRLASAIEAEGLTLLHGYWRLVQLLDLRSIHHRRRRWASCRASAPT